MQFLNLSVCNFGVFRDRHDFILSPDRTGAGIRNLVVLSGHNGAGKTTLFRAIELALHGSAALGERLSQKAYNDFLLSRFHRHTQEGALIFADESSVKLSCQYVISGKRVKVLIERSWLRSGQSVTEHLSVLEDGAPPDVPEESLQDWLNELTPLGLQPVCFFDAEQLNALGSPEQHESMLEETLSRLLALDLVGRLHSDLTYLLRKQGGGQDLEPIKAAVLRYQQTLEILIQEIEQHKQELDKTNRELEIGRQQLAAKERHLASEGGAYAAKRAASQASSERLTLEIETSVASLQELCSGLLPFALAPELCQQLGERLSLEADSLRQMAAADIWRDSASELIKELRENDVWQDLEVSPNMRDTIIDRFVELLNHHDPGENERPQLLHHLGIPDQDQLQLWINLVLNQVPQESVAISQQLRSLKQEQAEVQKNIHRAPDDELLKPIHQEIEKSEERLYILKDDQTGTERKLGELVFQHDETLRHLQMAADALASAQAKDRKLELAARSRLVLKAYEDALTRQRLEMLSENIVQGFNAICRKDHLLDSVSIDPKSFQVYLRSLQGRSLGIGDFSAGERQLYVLALLQALRKVSSRQLPLVIDTPLARLDEIHRSRFMNEYVPVVSEQVILFATDAELENGLLREAGPNLVRRYELTFDAVEDMTTVRFDQPIKNGKVVSLGDVRFSQVDGGQ